MSIRDHNRFLSLLYLCNTIEPLQLFNAPKKSFEEIIDTAQHARTPIVNIGAYCLMPNHIHLVLKEITEGGISRFMQKLSTGYTMYFNKRYSRSGALLQGTFKSRHVDADIYLKHLIAYVHLNPAELFDPRWKTGAATPSRIEKLISEFQFSSLLDYQGIERPHNAILDPELRLLYDHMPDIGTLVNEANQYYRSLPAIFNEV